MTNARSIRMWYVEAGATASMCFVTTSIRKGRGADRSPVASMADAAAWLSRVMGPALLLWCVALPIATAGPDWAARLFWFWFAPLPYFTAWIAATTSSWRAAATEGARLAAIHLKLCVILLPFGAVLFFLILPVVVIAVGGALGEELARRYPTPKPGTQGRWWLLTHQVTAATAAFCIMLISFRYMGDARGDPAIDGLPQWVAIPALTASAYLPHALASWVWRRLSRSGIIAARS